MQAVVTDADISSALAGLRALGRRAVPALAVGPSWTAAGLCSRYAAARGRTADVTRDPQLFLSDLVALLEGLNAAAPAQDAPVIYPGREETIDALLSGGPGMLRAGRLPYPGVDPVQRLRNKAGLVELAAESGVEAPRTLAEGSAAELGSAGETLYAGRRRRALVIKPDRPGDTLRSAAFAGSGQQLADVLAGLDPSQRLLVQEHQAGEQLGLALVLDRQGQVVQRFQHRVLRTWPLEGGATSMAVSVSPDEDLVAGATRLLRAAGYWGLAQLDVVRTVTGFSVIDVNPRYYNSMALSEASGINLAAAWHDVVNGDPAGQPTTYRLGVAYRWLEADLTVLRHRLRPLPRPSVGALWDWRDPVAGMLMGSQAWARHAALFAVARGSRVVSRSGFGQRQSGRLGS